MATDSLEVCNLALSRIGAKVITSLTADSCKEDRLCNQFYAKFRDELLKKYAWNFAKKTTPLNRTDLYEIATGYDDYVTITNIATSNPVVITGANSYSAGYTVKISDIAGTTELNDLIFEVAAANTATFSLLGVDGGKYGTYSSGGQVIRMEALTTYQDGYTYDMPTDCLKARALDSGENYEIYETRLLTHDDAPVLIYTKQVTDTTKFSATFEECLVTKLQMELCIPLLGAKEGIQIRKMVEGMHRIAIVEAAKDMVTEVNKSYDYDDEWYTARL